MSGVVGWISFSRDLVRDRPLITALTATMAQRGPDGEQVWVSPRAALGFRSLDTGSGRQPFVVDVDGGQVAVCVTGHPTSLTELRQRLRSAGRAVSDETPAVELLAQAYLQFKADFIPWLSGSFAIAIWDSRKQELILARDQVGSGQPLFFTNTSGGLLFASERKTLLAHPEVASAVNAAGLREVISHALPTGAVYSGFSSVGPAEIVRFSQRGWGREKYWKLETRPHTDDLETTIANIRAMLDESIREQVPDDPSQLIATLSGGIDSSSVAGLAAAELRRRGTGKLRTFTVDFVESEFRPDVMRDTKDEPYAKAVADFIDSVHTVVSLEATDILDPIVRIGMLRAKDYPCRIYDMETSQYLFIQHVAAQGSRAVLTGGAGDQLFHGARWSTDPSLIAAGTFPWVAFAQRHGAVHGFGTGLLNQDVLGALDLPTYYRDEYARAVAEVEFLPEEDEARRQSRIASYLVLTRGPLDSSPFAASGLQMRPPINYHKLIQYAYNIPAEMHGHGGIEKSLLRAAVADLLPEQVLRRKQSATPVSKHPSYAQRLQDELKAILADPQAPARALIDVQAATELANTPVRLAKDRLARAAVELTLQLNLWLDYYRVRLVL